jgi:hypothetical protein
MPRVTEEEGGTDIRRKLWASAATRKSLCTAPAPQAWPRIPPRPRRLAASDVTGKGPSHVPTFPARPGASWRHPARRRLWVWPLPTWVFAASGLACRDKVEPITVPSATAGSEVCRRPNKLLQCPGQHGVTIGRRQRCSLVWSLGHHPQSYLQSPDLITSPKCWPLRCASRSASRENASLAAATLGHLASTVTREGALQRPDLPGATVRFRPSGPVQPLCVDHHLRWPLPRPTCPVLQCPVGRHRTRPASLASDATRKGPVPSLTCHTRQCLACRHAVQRWLWSPCAWAAAVSQPFRAAVCTELQSLPRTQVPRFAAARYRPRQCQGRSATSVS